jgi:hypothetical protein
MLVDLSNAIFLPKNAKNSYVSTAQSNNFVISINKKKNVDQ